MSASRLSSRPPRLGNGFYLLLALLAWLNTATCQAGNSVLMVLSGMEGVYLEVSQGFEAALGNRWPVRSAVVDGMNPDTLRPAQGDNLLIVPVGMRAAEFVSEHAPPGATVLALLVPRQSFTALAWPSRNRPRAVSAVYLDQPLQRSLQLIDLLDPRLQRVGVLVSGGGQSLPDGLGEARGLGQVLNIRGVESGKDVGEGLRGLLPEVDVLLLVPDSLVANTANIQSVLLTSYRYRVPVVGYSPGLVNAGAVAAVYSTPLDIGREGAAMAAAWNPASGELPAARHASGFDLAVNERVARSLGLVLPDTRQLRRKLFAPR